MSIGPQHNGGILGATNNPTSTSAGGIWTPVQHYQAQRDGLWPVATAPLPDYTISRSLRFNKTDSAALNYTPAVAGNRKTWILSTWVKSPGTFMTNDNPIFAVRPGATPYTLVTLRASSAGTAPSALLIEDNASGMVLSTAMVFRDYSAWYHIVVAVDTTQSVSTNRVKMFVNGVQVTTFAGYTTYPNQNIDTQINSTNTHYIGRDPYDANNWYSGYLADFRFIDGYPGGIDGTSWNNAGSIINLFGETDITTGVWKPKAYSGSYGTNGFYLPFTDNSTQNNLGVNTAQVGDELRNYTVLHLSGNPANTSGYNCFSDRSSNNHLLTIAGDVRTSARSPFTDTTSGSAYFDGSSDYITVTNNNLFPATSTTAFTLEAWVYPTTSSGNYILTSPVASNTVRYCFMLGTNPDNSSGTKVVFGRFSAAWTYLASATSVSLNTWTHIACVFTGSTSQIYINGTLDASGGASTWVTGGSSTLTLGYRWDEYAPGAPFYFTGNLSNVRVTTGQALFTGNFTPSSSPLTSTAVGHTGTGAASSITGTVSLLTLVDKVGANNSGFIDESTNNAVITRSGNVTQGSFSPFGTSGWSYYFNGTGSSGPGVMTPQNSTFNLSTGDWTIEGWYYNTQDLSNSSRYMGAVPASGATYGVIPGNSGNFSLNNFGSPNVITTNIAPKLNNWQHVALVKSGSTTYLYIDGVLGGSAVVSWPNSNSYIFFGGMTGTYAWSFSGYISNFRVVMGTAIYTSNFTPSTLPLTAVAGTAFLTAQDNRLIDNSANNYTLSLKDSISPQVQPLSPFQPHTSVTNSYSTYFNGANSITATTNSLFALSGAFTVEFWLYPTSNSGEFISITSTGGLDIGYQNSTTFGIAAAGVAWRLTTTTLPTLNTWNHIVFSRGGTGTNQASLFINGTRVANGTLSDSFAQGTTIYLGSYGTGYYLTGYLSNLRIVKDQDLYGYNNTQISVPTSPLTRTSQGATASNVALLTLQSSTLVDNGINTITLFNNGAVEPRISEFNPLGRTFTTGVNYSPITHGSSAYFDGDVDHITTTTVNFSNQNYTIECWAYPTQLADGYLWQISNPSSGARGSSTVTGAYYSLTGKFLWFSAGGSFGGSSFDIVHSVTSPINAWTHIALVRNGNTFTQYINGVAVGSATVNATYTSAGTAFSMGRYYGNSGDAVLYFKGYIANYRQINGTALYTSNFVPQLQPPQAVANTQLLLNFNNAGVVDYTGKNVLETVGDSRSVTSTKKTLLDATGSMRFDGSVDALYIPSDPKFGYGTADFTIEFWVNIADTAQRTIFSHLTSGSGDTAPHIYYENASGIRYYTIGANRINGSALVVGTWYHIALCRSSGSTRLFIDGVQSGSTYADTNNYGTAKACIVGDYNVPPSGGSTFNGHIQDIRITRFARYTGTFTPPVRTFSATVRDVGHKQWVVNNLSVASGVGNDSLVDTPTSYGVDTGLGSEVRGNYCIWNPLNATGASTANGNLEATLTGNATLNAQIRGTLAPISGKWYWENTVTVDGNQSHWLGVIAASARADIRLDNSNALSQVVYARYDGQKIVNGTMSAYGASYTTGDIIGIALNLDLSTITFYKNNVSQGTLSLPTSGIAYVPVFWYSTANTGASGTVAANFGQRPFAYTAPSGYKALCTQNLPTPSIIKSNTAFDTLAYAGNDSQTISGLNFSPDLVWVKSRSNATYNHQVHDSVRGPTAGMLSTNSNAAENNTYQFTSFNSNGFTTASGNIAGINNSGNTFVAWAWDAGTSTVTNTAGNVTSQVRANPTAGISIVTYTGSNTTNGTVGHGLGVAPSFIILKNRSTDGWFVGHSSLGWLGNLRLEAQATFYNDSSNAPWGDTAPTSTVFTVSIGGGGWANASGNNYVAYCFAPISGFSAFGSYTGNGSTDGPFVYTGFKPRWVMIKRSDGAYSWWINDGARNPYNVVGQDLAANEITAESNDAPVQDFLSNGFKLRTSIYPGFNASGGNYVYAAFAENPFKYSLAR